MGTFRTLRLEQVMSVHWAKADIRLRASGSDFDARVRPVKANGGGWSNLWRLSAQDRWPSFARKNSGFLKGKAHFGDRKHKPIYRHKADIAVPGCPLLEGKQKTFARLELFSFGPIIGHDPWTRKQKQELAWRLHQGPFSPHASQSSPDRSARL